MHPLQGGIFRLKYRRDRRPGMPIEPVWVVLSQILLGGPVEERAATRSSCCWLELLRRRVRREQKRAPYTDLALTPVADDETETLEMFTHNEGARDEVAPSRKIAALTHGAGMPA